MIFQERSGPLTGIVTRTWFLATSPAARFEKILPTPAAHVIVNLSAPYRVHGRDGTVSTVPQAFVSGLQTEYLVIEPPDPIRHVGFELTPTGLAALSPDAPRRAAGKVSDASGLVGGLEVVAAAAMTDADAALAALGASLDARERHPVDTSIVEAVAMLEADTERPIADLAGALGLSARALADRFASVVGSTPKRFAQLLRFHRLLDAVHAAGGRPAWADLAVSAGYYDQPHVIREFRRFSGWTPAEYVRLVTEHGPDAARFVPLDEVPAQASS